MVDQVFYEQRVSYLVVEVTDKHKDTFLLKSAGTESTSLSKVTIDVQEEEKD